MSSQGRSGAGGRPIWRSRPAVAVDIILYRVSSCFRIKVALLQEDREFVAKVEAALEASQVDEEALLEERRRKRREILARHGQRLVPGGGEAPARSRG